MSKAEKENRINSLAVTFLERQQIIPNPLADQIISAYKEGYHQAEKDLIDKAIGWIKEINNHHHIMRYSDSCEPPLSELTEWFKNYMKEQNINSK